MDIFNVFHAVLTVYFVSAISLLSARENSMGRKYDLSFSIMKWEYNSFVGFSCTWEEWNRQSFVLKGLKRVLKKIRAKIELKNSSLSTCIKYTEKTEETFMNRKSRDTGNIVDKPENVHNKTTTQTPLKRGKPWYSGRVSCSFFL